MCNGEGMKEGESEMSAPSEIHEAISILITHTVSHRAKIDEHITHNVRSRGVLHIAKGRLYSGGLSTFKNNT
jgi:hypothetical protein